MTASDPLLKTQQVAEAFGVSVSSIKRWVDSGVLQAARTSGKHRLIGLSEALRFARSKGLPISALESFGAPNIRAVGPIDDDLRDRLTELLRLGDTRRSRGLIISAHESAGSAVPLADHLIRPVMARIGHAWEVGQLDVFQEHMASQIIASALMELIERASQPQAIREAPLALGATPRGDPYLLPLLLGDLTLREEGWDVRNLGVNLPLKSLAAAVTTYRPALVFLSVNVVTDAVAFVRDYETFFESAAAVGSAVVLGGRALIPDLRTRLVYASFGDRMIHLAEFARRIKPASGMKGALLDQPVSSTLGTGPLIGQETKG